MARHDLTADDLVLRIKEAFSTVFLVLGGMTASFYHREIMKQFPWVDAIMRGEGEVPSSR